MTRRRHHNGAPILYWVLLVGVVLMLVAGARAVRTDGACDGFNGGRQVWEWVPPGFVCKR